MNVSLWFGFVSAIWIMVQTQAQPMLPRPAPSHLVTSQTDLARIIKACSAHVSSRPKTLCSNPQRKVNSSPAHCFRRTSDLYIATRRPLIMGLYCTHLRICTHTHADDESKKGSWPRKDRVRLAAGSAGMMTEATCHDPSGLFSRAQWATTIESM